MNVYLIYVRYCRDIVGKPGWTTFVALLNNKISGTGSIYINGENAEIELQQQRNPKEEKEFRQHLSKQENLLQLKNNRKTIFVETAEPTPQFKAPSYRNMIKAGYTELYRRPNYLFKL